MKILLDECVPRILKRLLPEFDIKTVHDMGWKGIKNGVLLARADAEFDIFVTSDKNLRFQQNLRNIGLGILLLPGKQVKMVRSIIDEIRQALSTMTREQFVEIPRRSTTL
jgi:hypothetical protein